MGSLFATALILLVTGLHLASCQDYVSRRRPVIRQARDVPTTGCYIVAMKDDTKEAEMQKVLTKAVKVSDDAKLYGMVQKVKKAFTVKLNPYALEMVRHLPGVDYIEEEGFAVGDQDDTILPWHLDRIDQHSLPLDYNYSPIGDGRGVDVYILDSGINYDHEEFEYRAKYGGYDAVDEYNRNDNRIKKQYGRDCHGHGTHVASLCGGKTYGSAKKVNIYSIRVLECNNAAPWSVVINGLDYVSGVVPQRGRPAVVSMSFSGSYHRSVNEIVERLISEGITLVTVAGNGNVDSCGRSPASSDSVITVAGSSKTDRLYRSTNYGLCVDLFAPGSRVLGAGYNCTRCSRYLSGTSMAAPIVSGIAAVHLSKQPKLTPAAVKQLLVSESVSDALVYEEAIIPSSYWKRTTNSLLHITGSCGGSMFIHNSGTITSPNYPANYPFNLNCVWYITAEEGQLVQFDLYDLHLENKYDTLKVYDGSRCVDESNMVEEFTGFHGERRYTYQTESNVLCVKLITDGTISFKGFNATYTKYYNGTNIKDYCRLIGMAPPLPPPPTLTISSTHTCAVSLTFPATPTPTHTPTSPTITLLSLTYSPMPSPTPPVPDPNIRLPTLPPNPLVPRFKADYYAIVKMSPRQVRVKVDDLVADGYKVLWVSPYRVGPDFKPYFDVILTNSSEEDTIEYLDLKVDQMNQTIQRMRTQGYSAKYIVTRDRGKNPGIHTSYSAVFVRKNDILETEVFLRDSLQEYEQRLSSMTLEGYRLLSHSFCKIQGQIEVVSVYERDRRLAFNISVPNLVQWQSKHNLPFFNFSDIALALGREGYYPSYVESYNFGSGTDDSRFAAVFEKPNGPNLNWFRWALNTTTAKDTIRSELEGGIWRPLISLAYNYLGNVRHYLGFTRIEHDY